MGKNTKPDTEERAEITEETATETAESPVTTTEAILLRGERRELTREMFEELAALQCEPEEIIGYAGTTQRELKNWCKAVYGRPLDTVMKMVRQDGLIEIRRASFDALRKSATLIQQQYTRFLTGDLSDKAADPAKVLAMINRRPEEREEKTEE